MLHTDRSDATRATIADQTFLEFGRERLRALTAALGVEGASGPFLQSFERLLRPWGERRIGVRPRYRSHIADDEAPFEFSLAFSDTPPELQFYLEAQGEPPGLGSNMEVGRALLERAASELRAPLDRLRQVESLFFPEQPAAPFTSWLGVSWTVGQELALKVYLNPKVRGDPLELVREAMARLGFARAWSRVRERLSATGERRDELGIVSLDLASDERARVKIYLRHHRATIRDIDEIAKLATDYRADDVAKFYLAVADGEGPFLKKPAATVVALVDPDADRPRSAALAFPIGSYIDNDEMASARVARCLVEFGLSPESYQRAVRAFATRPLAERAGIHAHVTLRRIGGSPRVAVYLASEAYLRGDAEG